MKGDGSCADGAIVQAVEQSDHLDCLPLSQSMRHHARSTATFRQREVGAAMSEWTADDWVSKMPELCRDEEWQERCRATPVSEQPARSPAGELAFFRHVLGLPTHPVGRAYLHAAAGVLQQGILVLTTDHRYRPAAQQLDDFGTEQYDSSIVLFFSVGPLRPGSRGDGHYETVCLSTAGTPDVHTVFERHHPLLCSLRAWAASHDDERTLEHERVHRYCFPAIGMRPGERFAGPLAPSVAAQQPLAVSDSAQAGTRPRRLRLLPARLRDEERGGDDHADRVTPPRRPSRTAVRSLTAVLDGAASPAAERVPAAGNALPPRAARGPAAVAPAPAMAASRVPSSDRPAVLSELARRNLQAWVRESSGRGRLASRVHLSAVPMWTARCRTVLMGLAGALQERPMNETRVVTWLCVLWMLPREVFTVPGRSRGGKAGRKSRHHRIHHALSDATLLARLAARAEEGTVPPAQHPSSLARAVGGGREEQATGESLESLESLPTLSSLSLSAEGDAEDCSTAVASVDGRGTAPAAPTDSGVALRVEHLFRLGHAQRAMRSLVSTTGKADLDQAAERDALRALHPPCPSELPACPGDAPELVVDPAWMADEMQRSDTGAAPGPSGYGSNFVQVLAADAACVSAMAVLIGHIVNDTLPATVRSLLNTCVLVSLEKDGGGRRPVAMGDMFYRMAARFALSLVLEPAQRALRPHQFAVGVEDGCTQVVQSLQHLLSLPPAPAPAPPQPRHQFAFSAPQPAADPTPRPLACLSVDLTNAFNTVNRAALLRAVYNNVELAACWRMVSFGYGHSSLLLMRCGDEVGEADAFIASSNGVRQGDPLAALLFALAMHGVYAQVARLCRAGCLAYSDDSHGVGWLEECWRAWEALPALLEPLDLRLNAAKCELTCFHTDALQHARDVAALDAFRAAGVTVNTSALKVLGCVVLVTRVESSRSTLGVDADRLERVDPSTRLDSMTV